MPQTGLLNRRGRIHGENSRDVLEVIELRQTVNYGKARITPAHSKGQIHHSKMVETMVLRRGDMGGESPISTGPFGAITGRANEH